MQPHPPLNCFFFFNDTATTEIYTLSLHDALPISGPRDRGSFRFALGRTEPAGLAAGAFVEDRKSTCLNSSHLVISYAVFCLKKKKNHPEAEVSSAMASPFTSLVPRIMLRLASERA